MSQIAVRAPFGHALVDAEGRLVHEIHLKRGAPTRGGDGPLAADLRRYFEGERIDFSRYEVDWSPYTLFEREVLEATREIPYGRTRTYAELAAAIGRPAAARAVGQALGKNRTCIVVPCHRVVAANGGLGGFTGGVEKKEALLRLEGAL